MGTYPADGPLRISPNHTADDWSVLDPARPADWQRAVEILRNRLEGRFIKFADLILEADDHSGFAALAIDALLIEALQQFKEGKSSKNRSRAAFTSFLREEFAADFPTQSRANDFYDFVRNGILHAAETRGDVLVRRRGGLAITPAPTGSGFEVDPVVFHNHLKGAFEAYCVRLVAPAESQLRANLWERMGGICNIRKGRALVFVAETPK